ncbi:hypothetical protein PR048_025550 [Dryococelus australis]|uniref:Uncharacterized protein n=1 Tax=Dryococelus australis TaxID=614101 RepID=A0ABQ9GRL6_9NEOP|nr:hypothetical protein PR048_025550 [Dryococelus australis]
MAVVRAVVLPPVDEYGTLDELPPCFLRQLMFVYSHRKAKCGIGEIFSKVWRRCMTPTNIPSGFRGTRIYPFDSHVLPQDAFEPSTVSHLELQAETADCGIAGPTSSISNPQQACQRNLLSIDDASSEDIPLSRITYVTTGSVPEAPLCSSESPGSSNSSPLQATLSSILSTPNKSKSQNLVKKSLNYERQHLTTALHK